MTTTVPAPAAGGRRQRAAARARHRADPLRALRSRVVGRWQLRTTGVPESPLEDLVPAEHLDGPRRWTLAEVSERDLVGHFTRLCHRQFSVDLGAYPLGSCTMKYNPKICDAVAALPGLADVHPAAPAALHPGLARAPGRARGGAVRDHRDGRRDPAAGRRGGGRAHRSAAHAGLVHDARRRARHKVIIPDSAHGTNPASVTLGGYEVVTVPSRRPRLRRPRGAARRARRRRGRDHADQPEHPRAVRRGHRGHRRRRARGGRPPLLRRRQPQRHPRRGPTRATWASTSSISTCTRRSPPRTAVGDPGRGPWRCPSA